MILAICGGLPETPSRRSRPTRSFPRANGKTSLRLWSGSGRRTTTGPRSSPTRTANSILQPVDNPRGELDCAIEWKKVGWSAFIRDWRFDPDDVPDILYRLNRGQGTEVIGSEGRPLRIFVDPKEGKKGVESEVKKEGAPPDAKTRFEKLAADMVDEQLEGEMEIVVKDDLVRSIARAMAALRRPCLHLHGRTAAAFACSSRSVRTDRIYGP